MRFRSCTIPAVVLATALLPVAAQAGGYIAPVDTTPIAPVEPAPVGTWGGAYGGVSLGYSFGADDEVGLDLFEDGERAFRRTDLTNVEISGPTVDLHAGYRWQRSQWVYGPELAIEGGSVDADEDFTISFPDGFTGAGNVESSVNYIASLVFKAGYLVNPQTMIYGAAGVTHGDFDYKLSGSDGSATEGYTAQGYVLGLGVERQVSDRMSIFAEYQYRDFGREDVTFTDSATNSSAVTVATPKHQNVKMGINFNF